MKTANISYSQWKSLLSSKGMLPQYIENTGSYDLFAVEANVSWETTILKGSSDGDDFETNIKSEANAPMEHRSSDGLQKYASAMFVDSLNFYVDGENGYITIPAGQTGYSKTHFSVPFSLNGIDVHWVGANAGDYINLEVGVYTEANNEASFTPLAIFGNKYRTIGDNSKTFQVDTVKIVPPTYSGLDVYIRTTYVNAGSADVQLFVNLMGYK